MKTTGIYTQTKYIIDFEQYNDPITIIPFGDVHRSSNLCHTEKWFQFLNDSKKIKNCYFLGMGDYDDLSSTSEREILNYQGLHESTKGSLEEMYYNYTDRFYKEISFMKGKVIGLMEGNHYSIFSNGMTTTQYLCQLMGCTYLGVSAFIMLILKHRNGYSQKIDIWSHHGLGGGRTLGSSINKLEQMIDIANADIYLMGHDHKKHIAMKSRLNLSYGNKGLRLVNKKILLARTGAFLKGYEDKKVSYIADKAMSPTDIGTIKIKIIPRCYQKSREFDLKGEL